MMRFSILLVVLAVAAIGARSLETTHAQPVRRMSFHNRVLLNRAVVSGLKTIEMLVLSAGRDSLGFRPSSDEAASLAARLGGRVLRTEGEIGYLRVHVPIDRVLDLVASPAIEVYQIASLSKGSWYRDSPARLNAEMFREYEVVPIAPTEPSTKYAELPVLSADASRTTGYTAEDDVGLREWMAAHPTFDGRGVTIALVESADPAFDSPVLRTAKALDGRDVPKVAGILNSVDATRRDDTRVTLATPVRGDTGWTRIGSRTYILPRPGAYRFGVLAVPAGANVVHQFGVLEHEETREVWLDTDGDASFQDESPLADVNERFEPRLLELAHPRRAQVSFVMGRGRAPNTVHIYIGKSSHQTMTLSVAAGSRTDDSLAYGVAPNARVLFVRVQGSDYELATGLEGFIEAAQRTDVDVICASSGIAMVPDTSADFVGLLFQRLVNIYRKPIFDGAGNSQLRLGTAISRGEGLSVGGSFGRETHATFYGGRPLDQNIVHPVASAGPSLDGSITPDFVAPVERLAADLPWKRNLEAVPDHSPTHRLPPGYQVSCCTSASSPYAAGVTALLISGAKQMKVAYSVETLARAMKFSARFLPTARSHEQGNGVLDINAAWSELTHSISAPQITASARVVHPLAEYAARGSDGVGILEVEGWTTGMTGTREIRFRRESGPDSPVTYRLTWTGNDGTFQTAPAVTLPLRETVTVRIRIALKRPGAHSALLELRSITSNAIVFRTQATVVAAERIDPSTGSVRVAGRVGPMGMNPHYIQVPAGAAALSVELEVLRGAVSSTILPTHGLFPAYYSHRHPADVRGMTPGKHQVILANPQPGTWAVHVSNTLAWPRTPGNTTPVSDSDAEYVLTVRPLALGTAIVRR